MVSNQDVGNYLVRNKVHNERLFVHYDPIVGEGSPIQRVCLYLARQHEKYVKIPLWMAESDEMAEVIRCGDVPTYCDTHNVDIASMMQALHYLRCKYDFEYWCATCCFIKDKQSGKMVNLILNNGQRKVYKEQATKQFSRQPVRILICKARQWGGSTETEAYMLWVQTFHEINWNSVIVAHQKDPARNVRAMYNRMCKFHPADIATLKLSNFEGSSNNKYLEERGSVISIGTALKPDALRSDDIKMAHFSEVGLYKRTREISPEALVQAIVSSVPSNLPNTVITLESTAKGIGNYFYEQWQKATNGESAYTPLFVGWWELPQYWEAFESEEEKIEFILSMSEVEQYRFSLGATLEGLKWYRKKLLELSGDIIAMMNEYPSTPEEAFAATQRFAHNPLHLKELESYCKEPKFKGEIMADAQYGAGAINNSLQFVEQPNGNLWIWQMPDKSVKMRNRYVVAFDMGGRSSGADYSVISVLDRYYLMHGGCEERVATYRFHLDHDLAAWKAVQLAKFYNEALLAPEINSAVSDSDATDGDHSLTIFDVIKPHYFNIYARTNPQRVKEGKPALLGFHTNKKTKSEIVDHYNACIREGLYIERDIRAIYEARHYEIKPNGSYGNIDGKDEHDDLHMSTMIALKVSSEMPMPTIVETPTNQQHSTTTSKPRGLAEM